MHVLDMGDIKKETQIWLLEMKTMRWRISWLGLIGDWTRTWKDAAVKTMQHETEEKNLKKKNESHLSELWVTFMQPYVW